MAPHLQGHRGARQLGRIWPESLLLPLAAGALFAAATPAGAARAALALAWVAAAAGVALAAFVRRETAPGGAAARDGRLLALGVCAVHAA
ncbi:MAG TPA: hypothetical protein VN317_01455, partial [Candidatus Methanoperedens sp.]|nr:hypothetical protein [Candidatus Methanoperedens sp.]